MLFKMYPKLPTLLEEIHTSTLRPLEELDDNEENGHRHRNGRKNKEEPWTFDKGLEKGREALNLARYEHECVREYSDLILQILSGEAGMSTAELVQVRSIGFWTFTLEWKCSSSLATPLWHAS